MSKYAKKKTSRKKGAGNQWLILLLVVCAALLCGAVYFITTYEIGEAASIPGNSEGDPSEPPKVITAGDPVPTEKTQIDTLQDVLFDLGNGLSVTEIGRYSGIYLEDGSDEIVSGVLMLVLINNSDQALQYAEIELTTHSGTAFFTASTIPAGESVVLLEQNRMQYEANGDYTHASARNVVFFSEPLSLLEDQFEIQVLDGAMNIRNISGEDITGEVVIYYKNSAADMYYGGITYCARIEEGFAADEIKQIMASHFSDTGSSIMFVTAG